MITTENIKLKINLPADDVLIEKELKERGIEPLRWAITAVVGEVLTINVSYEK